MDTKDLIEDIRRDLRAAGHTEKEASECLKKVEARAEEDFQRFLLERKMKAYRDAFRRLYMWERRDLVLNKEGNYVKPPDNPRPY